MEMMYNFCCIFLIFLWCFHYLLAILSCLTQVGQNRLMNLKFLLFFKVATLVQEELLSVV